MSSANSRPVVEEVAKLLRQRRTERRGRAGAVRSVNRVYLSLGVAITYFEDCWIAPKQHPRSF